MTGIKTGLIGLAEQRVTPDMTAACLGSGTVDVLGTPALVVLMEQAAVAALAAHLPVGQTSVGVRIDVRHLAATPPGGVVRARAELIAVQGRRLTFRIEAADAVELIGEAVHERLLVDQEQFVARAMKKL